MSILLIQSSTGSVQLYLETTGGSAAASLTTSDVQIDLKKNGEAFYTNKPLTADTDATASIGGGANGTINLAVPGTAGNTYTVEVTVPAGTSALAVTKAANVLTVALGVSGGVPVPALNTATAIAAAITALGSEVQATATGTGADSVSSAEGPTGFTGGDDGDFTNLGAGFYELDLTASDTDTLGSLAIRVTGITIKSSLTLATVATAVASSPTPTLTVPTTTIFGYLRKADGTALVGATAAFRVLSAPTVLNSGGEGLAVSTALVSSVSDSDGYFSAELVSGAAIDVFIPAANYRRTFTVPSTSTNLFDIP